MATEPWKEAGAAEEPTFLFRFIPLSLNLSSTRVSWLPCWMSPLGPSSHTGDVRSPTPKPMEQDAGLTCPDAGSTASPDLGGCQLPWQVAPETRVRAVPGETPQGQGHGVLPLRGQGQVTCRPPRCPATSSCLDLRLRFCLFVRQRGPSGRRGRAPLGWLLPAQKFGPSAVQSVG